MWYLRYAFKSGMTIDEIHELTHIDPWFLEHLHEIVELEDELRAHADARRTSSDDLLRRAKQFGFSDRQLATIWSTHRDRRPRRSQAPRHRRHVQVGRYLRRRVRGLHAVLLLDLRRRGRNARQAARPASGS